MSDRDRDEGGLFSGLIDELKGTASAEAELRTYTPPAPPVSESPGGPPATPVGLSSGTPLPPPLQQSSTPVQPYNAQRSTTPVGLSPNAWDRINDVLAKEFNRFATDETLTAAEVSSDIRALGYAPEIIGSLMDYWSELGTSSSVLSALHSNLGGAEAYEKVLHQAEHNPGVAEFFTQYGNEFTPEEREQLTLIFASVRRAGAGEVIGPNGEKQEPSVGDRFYTGFANTVFNLIPGFEGDADAEKVSRGLAKKDSQKARAHLGAWAIEYLRQSPLETDADRKEFFIRLYGEAGNKVKFLDVGSGALGAVGQVGEIIATPFRGTSEALSRTWANVAAPEDFAHRRFLTWGQQNALALGQSPEDPFWNEVSGAFDFWLNLSPADPINLLGNMSSGVKAAKTVSRPQNLSKGRAVLKALRPFAGRSMDLPVMGRGMLARVTYVLASKTGDQIAATPKARKAMSRILDMDNAAEIGEVFPGLKMAPETRHILASLSKDKGHTVDTVAEVLKAGQRGGVGKDSASMLKLLDGEKVKAAQAYGRRLDEALSNGEIGILHMEDAFDGHKANGVWQPVGIPLATQDVTIKHAFGSRKVPFQVAESGEVAFQGSPNIDLETIRKGGISLAPGRAVGYIGGEGGRVFAVRISDLPDDVQKILRSGQDVEALVGPTELRVVAQFIESAKQGVRLSQEQVREMMGLLDDQPIPGWFSTIAADASDPALFSGVSGVDDLTGVAEYMKGLPKAGKEFAITMEEITAAPFTSFTKEQILEAEKSGLLGTTPGVYKAAEAVGDGATKTVIPTQIVGDFKTANLTNNTQVTDLASWAANQGDDAYNMVAKLATDRSLAKLDDNELDLLRRWAQQGGHHAVRIDDEMITTTAGASKLRQVQDLAEDAAPKARSLLAGEMAEVERSRLARTAAEAEDNAGWVFIDMPRESWRTQRAFKRIKAGTGRNGALRQLRRRVRSSLRDTAPSRISLKNTRAGSSGLRRWLEALGVDEGTVNDAITKFEAARSTDLRYQIVHDAFREAGDKIDNPLLRHRLLEFIDQQDGIRGFETAAGGEDIGLLSDGHAIPITEAMRLSEFKMPDWKDVSATLRRYRHGKNMPEFVTRGFGITNPKTGKLRRIGRKELASKTYRNRQTLLNRYKAHQSRTVGRNVLRNLEDEDLLAMAYSDVLGGGRGAALTKMRSMATGVYKGIHHTFTMAMLLGMPVRWMSRVLLEETIRANLASMPSLWKNPKEFMSFWWDSHLIRGIEKRERAYSKELWEVADTLFDPKVPDAVLHNNLKELIPNFDTLATDAGVNLASRTEVKAFTATMFGYDIAGTAVLNPAKLGRKGMSARRAILRTRRRNLTAKDTLKKHGLPEGFTWDDVPDIQNRSMFSEWMTVTGDSIKAIDWKVGGMSPTQIKVAGRGYGRQFNQVSGTPSVRFAMKRMVDPDLWTGERAVRTKWWHEIRGNAERLASDRGVAWANDAELAEWFLDNATSQWPEHLFRAFWTNADGSINRAERVRILSEVAGSRTLRVEINGQEFVLTGAKDDRKFHKAAAAGEKLAEEAYNANIQLFDRINTIADPLAGEGALGGGPERWRRFTDGMMNVFGEQASQRLNRQPSFMFTYGKWRQRFLDLGWDEATASAYASEKAAQLTNHVFFSNIGTSRFLKSMNNVIPFFSAWWEVLSTWGYKIPTQEHLFIGYPHLIRKVDRFLDGLVYTGLLEPTDSGYTLTLDREADLRTKFGSGLSKLGYHLARGPVTGLEFVTNIGKAAFGEESVDWSAHVSDQFQLQIGNPLDINSTGIMAVNQWGFGFNPLISGAISLPWIGDESVYDQLGRLPFAASEERADLKAGTSLVEFLNEHNDVQDYDFLSVNAEALKEALGETAYADLLARRVTPEQLMVQKDVSVLLPQSSVWQQFIDETVFPFGQFREKGQMIGAFTPTSLSYALRGLGLMWMDDPDTASGLAGMMFGPVGEYQIGSQLIASYRHLEATEGLLSKHARMLGELEKRLDESGLTLADGISSDWSDDLIRMRDDVEALGEEITRRAIDNAGGSMLMRGFMGFFLPTTPRMVQDEQNIAAQYWNSRDIVQAAKDKNAGVFFDEVSNVLASGVKDPEMLNTMIASFFNDGTGDELKAWVRTNHPGVMPFLEGATFWGPSGPPPEIQQFDQFWDQVNAGLRAPIPEDVWFIRNMRNNIAMDREIEMTLKYGKDPVDQLQGFLNDGVEYEELMDEYSMRFDAVDWFDEEFNGGGYHQWRERNADDEFTVLSELEERYRDSRDSLDELENALNFLNLPSWEQQDIISKSRAAYREILNTIGSYQDEIDRSGFENPREHLISQFFANVANPYYEERNGLFEDLSNAKTDAERSFVFDKLQQLDNEHFLSAHSVDYDGQRVPVVSEIERQWNRKTPEEQEAELRETVGTKPEWLSMPDAVHLVEKYPQAAEYIPNRPEDFTVYNQVSDYRDELEQQWIAGELSTYELNQAKAGLDEVLQSLLIGEGRDAEVKFREAWPIQRLALLGMLPPSLQPVLEQVNAVQAALTAAEVGPRSEYGLRLQQAMKLWLDQYYQSNPQAEVDVTTLGGQMFEESLLEAIYEKLLYGIFF